MEIPFLSGDDDERDPNRPLSPQELAQQGGGAIGDVGGVSPEQQYLEVSPRDIADQMAQDRQEAGFIQSAISAGGREMLGQDADRDIEEYRIDNPFLGAISQIAGQVPYFALPWTRTGQAVARGIPGSGRLVREGDRAMAEGRTGSGLLQKELGTYGPLESGRTALTAATGGDVQDIATDAMVNVGVGALVAGGIGSAMRAPGVAETPGSRLNMYQRLDEEFDAGAPDQVQLRHLRRLQEREDLDPETLQSISDDIQRLRAAIRDQDIPRGQIQEIEGTHKDYARALDRRFRARETDHISVKKMNYATEGRDQTKFESKDRLNDVIQRSGLKENFEEHVQFQRYVRPKNRATAKQLHSDFQRALGDPSITDRQGRPIWVKRENNEQGFIVARKFNGTSEPDYNDEFIMFRTDNPNMVLDEDYANFGNAQARQVFGMKLHDPNHRVRSRIDMAHFGDEIGTQTPHVSALQGIRNDPTRTREWTSAATSAVMSGILGPSNAGKVRHAFGEAGRQASRAIHGLTKDWAQPSMSQFRDNPRAARMFLTMRAVKDWAEGQISKITAGELTQNARRLEDLGYGSGFREVLSPTVARKGLNQMVDDLSNDAYHGFFSAFRRGLGPEDARQEGYPLETIEFMEHLKRLDDHLFPQTRAAFRLLGDDITGLENHMLLPRMWEGTLRRDLVDSRGATVAKAGGHSHKHLDEEADALIEYYRDTYGMELQKGRRYSADHVRPTDEALQLDPKSAERNVRALSAIRRPQRFEQRHGVGGFIGQRDAPSRAKTKEMLNRSIREHFRIQQEKLIRHDFQEEFLRLQQEDPSAAQTLLNRYHDLIGTGKPPLHDVLEQGWNNKISPLIGANARDISRTVNEFEYHLSLGSGNVGFAALNALTFLQTSMPWAAMAMSAPPQKLQRFFSPALIANNGRMKEMRFLDPMRFAMQGFRDMRNPSPEFMAMLNRGRQEGVVSPQLESEVFGPDANIRRHMQSVLRGDRDFATALRELSSFMPAKSEEISRGIGLSMGYRIGKDFYNLEGERLYQFAREFLNNSQFRYDSADRPRIITGAFGNVAGLFKNWMLHYISMTSTFVEEGFSRGNWKPLLWSQVGAGSVAGATGTMAYNAADGFHRMASEEDETFFEGLYNQFGQHERFEEIMGDEWVHRFSDAIYFGLPQFLNLGLHHRGAVPGADIPNDIEQLFTVATWDRAASMGEFISEGWDSYLQEGQHPSDNRRVWDAFARFAFPNTLQNYMQVTEDRALHSMRTGNKLISDVTYGEQTLNALGFQPSRIARSYEAASVLRQRQEEKRQLVETYGEMVAQAREERDDRAIWEAYMRATNAGLEPDRVTRSADARQAKRDEPMLQRRFDDLAQQSLRENLGL